jgi:hypothetical protein
MRKIIAALFAIAGIYLPTFAVAQVPLQTLRTCLEIEDQSKERLDCYDEKIAPAPKQISAPAKTVQDCRFIKEEDERLTVSVRLGTHDKAQVSNFISLR